MSEPNQEKLFRYLLGDLQAEERMRIEELYFTEDAAFDDICAAEDELVRAYLAGELRRSLRRSFEKRLTQSPGFRQRVVLAQDLMEVAGPARSEQVQLRFSNIFQRPLFAFSTISLMACMLAGIIALTIGSLRISKQQDRLEASLKGFTATKAIAAFVLQQGSVQRDPKASSQELLVPVGVEVQLDLLVPETAYRSFEAYLETAEGAQVWNKIMLSVHRTDSGPIVTLDLPPVLREGDYVLRLRGANEHNSADVASYVFRVKTPE